MSPRMERRPGNRPWLAALRGMRAAGCTLILTAFSLPALPVLAAELHVWKQGIILPKSDAGFIEMADQAEFAHRQGLEITPFPVQSDSIGMKALLAGEIDSYEGSPGDALIAASRGADVKVIGCSWPQLVHGIFVRADISDLKQLKGKTFAISAPAAMPDLLARAAFRQAGLDPAEVSFASLGGDTDRYKALEAGVAQGAVISTEYLPIASKDVRLLAAGRDLMPNFMRVCVMTTSKTIAARPEDIARFMAAEITGLTYAASHRDQTVALTRKLTRVKEDDPRPAFLYDEVTQHHDIDPQLQLHADKLAWMQQLLVKAGNIQHPIDIAQVTDPAVREKALQIVAQQTPVR